MGMKGKKTTSIKKTNKGVPIVAIGASAGGIEALAEILKNLSSTTGMAFVYIQHLNATQESKLTSILSKVTNMQVLEAVQDLPINANCLYIIPPGKDMIIVEGKLKLSNRRPKTELHYPIDQFFSSLASYKKQATIGVLLSGSSNDGTLGLKAIKEAGGITIAQDETALFQSMPQSAVSEDLVDLVLSPAGIAKELERLSGETENILQAMIADEQEEANKADSEDIINIIHLLKKTTGVDFSHYKRSTIYRRIVRRMLLYKYKTPKEYHLFLKQNSHEVTRLYQDLLINVTCFFREPDTIEYLKKIVFPKILKTKSTNESIRIWVPACSTGEEAYSLAMILLEILGSKAATTSIQIFATDLSENAINKARQGLYSKINLLNMPAKRLQRFFTKVDGGYRIVKSIRDLCVFAPHNIFKDPPFSRLDFISCCNLFIYLEPILQKKIIATFHYALNSNGFLMLGASEALTGSSSLFSQLEKKYKVYSRKEASAKAFFEMNYRLPDNGVREIVSVKKELKTAKTKTEDIDKSVDTILLSKFVPPSIIVNQELEILQFRGSTGLFLEPSSGKASFNLLKMAKPELVFDLRNIIHKANKLQQPIKKTGIKLKQKNIVHYVSIEAMPLRSEDEERLFLIVFDEKIQPGLDMKPAASKDKQVKKLQEELNALHEDLRSILEDQETNNEELQSANEEIVSSNEELQSINEELETSKEEVESANEELMTINLELQIRNDQLAEAYEYSEAVFTTMRASILVLDKDLRVKNANQSFYKTFNLKEQHSEEHIIYEIGNGQWKIPALYKALENILSGNSTIQDLEIKHEFPVIGEKILLMNIRRVVQKSHRKEWILIAIEDITEHRQAERIIREREAWFRHMADSAPVMIWVTYEGKKDFFFNKTWYEYTGKTLEETTGEGWQEVIYKDDKKIFLSTYDENFQMQQSFSIEYRIKRRDGAYRWVICHGKPTYSPDGKFTGYIGSIVDIHEQKKFSDALEQRVNERTKALQDANVNLKRSNDELGQFAYVASHDLQEPLRKILTFSDLFKNRLKEEVSENANKYIGKISDSARRMTYLIDDLLNFSKVAASKDLFEKVDLNAIIAKVLKNFDLIIHEKNIHIQLESLPEINAVPVQMQQLFHNLIGNAIKFSSSSETPKIIINAHLLNADELRQYSLLDQNGNYYQIVVKDNGIGFDAEYSEQIFVIFQRLNEKSAFPGTGIGLALCKKIVAHHGGIIFAKSEKGKGASFYIVLPASY
jgi:two-component system CheB/CheR fusion protein